MYELKNIMNRMEDSDDERKYGSPDGRGHKESDRID